MNGTLEKIASPKQLKWLKSLLDERTTAGWPTDWAKTADLLREAFSECEAEGYEPEQLNVWFAANERESLTHNDFQRLLEKLKGSPYAAKSERAGQPVVGGTVVTEDGIYRLPDGRIYKVKWNRAKTNLYASRLYVEQPDGGKVKVWFEYERNAMRLLKAEHKMTYEQAKEFGALYGACVACGRLLTNELSIVLGIGPVCGGREFGGSFKFMIDTAKLQIASKG